MCFSLYNILNLPNSYNKYFIKLFVIKKSVAFSHLKLIMNNSNIMLGKIGEHSMIRFMLVCAVDTVEKIEQNYIKNLNILPKYS